METKYYVILSLAHYPAMVWSNKAYPRTEASERADALGEKHPNAYVDIVSEYNAHNVWNR